ncbi:hypothetical protein NCAS_0J00470 [Naumovozyma castellii]|uniref:Uncharacterized protein n=1 Tax=Naumovozyma castellii TaxID=27288 RepID=G0VKJ0_NAUCA|nr:hypothetical protein NCAS_0J00470 [Naumovozyma castellii CBS 4309]CCC72026.1 hypothetical protein NCAS_0J00470 [Naumovozyma castellii CBS 4309]
MVISASSIESLKKHCQELSNYSTVNTTVLISADFGCELELIALEYFKNRCKCVLSILCEVECRRLYPGSYIILNEDHCILYFGSTYLAKHYRGDRAIQKNYNNVHVELTKDSNTLNIIKHVKHTKWIKTIMLENPKDMALKTWENVFPKISLNILSIIFNRTDYEKLLQDKPSRDLFRDLVHELVDICYKQCQAKLYFNGEAPYDKKKNSINSDAIIKHYKQLKLDIKSSVIGKESLELSLPFEVYCFYNKIEYPVDLLFYQTIFLAKKFGIPHKKLLYLFELYSNLTTTEHFPKKIINFEEPTSVPLVQSNMELRSTAANSKKSQSRNPNRNYHIIPGEDTDGHHFQNEPNYVSTTLLSSELKNLYLGAEKISSFDSPQEKSLEDGKRLYPNIKTNNNTDYYTAAVTETSFNIAHTNQNSTFNNGIANPNQTRRKSITGFDVKAIPHFIKRKLSFKKESMDNEDQVRNPRVHIPRNSVQTERKKQPYDNYDTPFYAIQNNSTSDPFDIPKDEDLAYFSSDPKSWRSILQKRTHSTPVPRHKWGTNEDINNTREILNRANIGNILSLTSSNYEQTMDLTVPLRDGRGSYHNFSSRKLTTRSHREGEKE